MTFWQACWDSIKRTFRWIGIKLVAPGVGVIVAVVLIITALFVAATVGVKLPIGGILEKFFGKKPSSDKDTPNTIPKGRTDSEGKPIPIGTPDSQGITQVPVVSVDESSDSGTVKITPPGETKPVEVQLPDGVKPSTVDTVLVIQPEVPVVITVKDDTGLSVERVDDLIKKYGG